MLAFVCTAYLSEVTVKVPAIPHINPDRLEQSQKTSELTLHVKKVNQSKT